MLPSLQICSNCASLSSFDGINHLGNGVWHQEQPADRIEFPYILIKVHTPVSTSDVAQGSLPEWMLPLVEQGLMLEVGRTVWGGTGPAGGNIRHHS